MEAPSVTYLMIYLETHIASDTQYVTYLMISLDTHTVSDTQYETYLIISLDHTVSDLSYDIS